MASIADLPLKYRLFLRAYRYRRLTPCPWSPPVRPLGECRVALITSAAFYLPEQQAFDEKARGGDPSYRILPARASPERLSGLRIGQRSGAFDPSGIESDFNLALPTERFRELEEDGTIGRLHDDALSFMGSVTAPIRLVKDSAPEAARRLRAAGVDVAFLCPV
ncbi:MAG: glycine/sarcosine/betaine reductase selenoprotein B family protein [Planctomycetota bacterium]|nr:glycine/sarcosine/betaine reductase selenoprotein B family protein [Planctomycetota bacterium]